MKKIIIIILISIITFSANAQWKAYGPTSRVEEIVKYKDKIFAGCWQNVYFSDNNAESWCATKSNFVNSTYYRCFTYSDKYIYVGFESGIYRSSDEGLNWVFISPDPFTGASCMRAYNDSLLFVSDQGRIFKGSEKDLDFKDISGYFRSYNLMVGKNDTVFMGGNYPGLFISEDAGRNWRELTNGLDTNLIIDLKLRNGEVYINTNRSCYKSSDNGKSWVKCFDSLNSVSRIVNFYFDKNRILVYTKQCLKYSDDEGKSWNDANAGLPNYLVTSLIAKDDYYYVSNKFGVYRSNKDIIAWTPMNTNLANSFVTDVALSSACLVAKTGGVNLDGLYISKDKGKNWEMKNPDSLDLDICYTFAPGKIISYFNDKVKYSSNNGITWVDKSAGIDDSTFLSSPCIIRDTIYIYGTGNTIFKADTTNLEWTQITTNLPEAGISSIFAFKDNLYAVNEYEGIYEASDNNTNWHIVSKYGDGYNFSKIQVKGDKVYSYLIDPNGDSQFVFSMDLLHWYQLSIETKPNNYFDYLIRDNDIYAIVGSKGVLKSTDEGEHWSDFNNGLNNYEVVCLTQDSTHLYLATQGGGVNVFDFTDLYSAPSLIAPSNKAIKNPASITFNWSHSNEISEDVFELAFDLDFKNITKSEKIKTGDITVSNLMLDTLYYWRVKSVFPGGEVETSEIWTVNTKYVNSVGLQPNDRLSVSPNPANDMIIINYRLENVEKVNIYLVDVLGNKLYEANGLRNEEQYSINVTQITAGIYYLILDTGLNQIKEK